MASGSDYAHAVVTARVGGVETGGQGTIPEETAGGVRVLWHHDQVQYVSVSSVAVAMDVSGTERSEIRSMTRAGVVAAAPPEHEQSFGWETC